MPRLLLLIPTATYRAGAFVDAARRLDIDISFASEKPNALASYQPVDLLTLELTDPDACADAMERFANEHAIDAVVAVDDGAALAASAIGERLRLPHNPIDASRATLDKRVMRDKLAAANVPAPTYTSVAVSDHAEAQLRHIADTIGFPCVVKPVSMSGSRGVLRADDDASLSEALARVRAITASSQGAGDAGQRILAERYVAGWEVAIEGILTDGRLDVFTIFDKPDPLEGPTFPETFYVTPSRLPLATQQDLYWITQHATTALGLRHGPIHAEVRGNEGGLWFIEVASRSIGGMCSRALRFEDGCTLEDVIVAHALSPHGPPPRREQAAAGVLMLQPPNSGKLARVDGVDDAVAVTGVEEVLISAHPGQTLTPLPEGFLYAGFVFARGGEADAVERSLREAQGRLTIVMDPL